MNSITEIKQSAYNQLQNLLDEKINNLLYEIGSIRDSRNSDTKSSAGDKFETGREMMNIELGKNESLLSKTRILKNNIFRIKMTKLYNKVEFGSFVKTDSEMFFISIGIGKMEVNNNTYYAISITSPMGKALQDKQIGDRIQFLGRDITIESIV